MGHILYSLVSVDAGSRRPSLSAGLGDAVFLYQLFAIYTVVVSGSIK